MNKKEVDELINKHITDNEVGDITAQKLREVLHALNKDVPVVVDELGKNDKLAISQRAVTEVVELQNERFNNLSESVTTQLNSLGYTYIGTATPSTIPVTLTEDSKVFYIVTKEGDYANFGVGTISEPSVIKSENGSWSVENLGLKFLSLTGGQMQGNIDMNGKRIDNIGIEEVNSLPTTNLYEGRMVRFKNTTYTFYNGLWLALSDDLRGHANDTHEENFVYQPTASDLSVKDGFANIKKLKGNTLVWNQRDKTEGANLTWNGITMSWNDGILTLNGTANSVSTFYGISNGYKSIPKDRKFYNKIEISGTFVGNDKSYITHDLSQIYEDSTVYFSTEQRVVSGIRTSALYTYFGIKTYAGDVFTDVKIKARLFDLTQMFGEGNEPATVEEFEAMFPNEYYEYNEGELMSFDGKGLKSVGFNQFDKSKVLFNAFINVQGNVVNGLIGLPDNAINGVSDWIKVFPNTDYFVKDIISSYYMRCAAYDVEKNYITSLSINTTHTDGNIKLCSKKITIPNNAHYIRFGVSDKHIDSICINLSHSGYRDGEYEPYEDYKLSFQDGKTISQLTGKLNGEGESVTIFPDGLRSAGAAYDEIVYDEATGKYKAVKRIGSVDMGALNWSNNNMGLESSIFIISSNQVDNINMARNKSTTSPSNMLSVDYYPSPTYSLAGNNVISGPFSNSLFGGALIVKNTSYTDVNSFKASLQGQILYYELAEPEVYELDFPINTRYGAYDFGTEEVLYSDDKEVNIPMKASVEYGFNAVDMIRNNFEEIRSLKERVTALELAIQQMQAFLTNAQGDISTEE